MRSVISILMLASLLGCGKDPEAATPDDAAPPPAAAAVPQLPLTTFGDFEYKDKMKLPEDVTKWNGKRVRATGYMNPTKQVRDLTKFLLVKDLQSCCFGKLPQINHYIDVKLKEGETVHYAQREPVTVEGVIVIDDRWDGDWPLGLYWMENAEVVE